MSVETPVPVEEHVTTALDVLGTLAIAAGVLLGLWPLIGGWSVACGGGVVLLGVRIIEGGVSRLVARFRKGSP